MDFSYEEQLRGLIKIKVQKMPEHQNLSEYLESIRGIRPICSTEGPTGLRE